MARFFRWLRRFLGRHRPASVGFTLLALITAVALVGPMIAGYEPMRAFASNLAPGGGHWLGTDPQGYDLLARMVHGARTTLLIALAATVLSLLCGIVIGAVAGFYGGWADTLLMRAVDFLLSFPAFLLAVVTVAILGKELENLIYAVGLVGAPAIARQVRAEVLRVQAREYVTAATALGLHRLRILAGHVLPNCMGPVIVLGTLGMGGAILEVAALNFLGLGGDPYKVPEWGLILKQGWSEGGAGTLQVTVAGFAIFASVLGFNLLGDGLKDELDPRTRRTRA